MYCRNCGNPMDVNASVCVRCGCSKGSGVTFCPNCGQTVVPGATHCGSCGCGLHTTAIAATGAKSKVAAGLLGIFLGWLGIHNFYLGFTGKAVAQLLLTILSCGALSFVSGIWGLIEGILILCGSAGFTNDAYGVPLSN